MKTDEDPTIPDVGYLDIGEISDESSDSIYRHMAYAFCICSLMMFVIYVLWYLLSSVKR